MTLQTWLKGLLVFVISAFITSLAAVNISPSTFSFFTADGLKKLGLLVLVIGVKAVVLYLKQSPLPIGGAGAAGSGISATLGHSLWMPVLFCGLVLGVAGCAGYQIHQGSIPIAGDQGSFDSHTADFLAEEKAFLDEADQHTADYNEYVSEVFAIAHQQYQVTKTAYLAWRAVQTAAALTQLQQSKTQLTNAVNNFTAARSAQMAAPSPTPAK